MNEGQNKGQKAADHRVIVAILQGQVEGLQRGEEQREDRLRALESRMNDMGSKFDALHGSVGDLRVSVERRMGEMRDVSWKQTWVLAAMVLASALGMTVYMMQKMTEMAVK